MTMRGIIRTTVASAIVFIAAVAVVGSSSMGASAAGSQNCATVKAGGQTYGVSAQNISCRFARQWVTKLAGKRVAKVNGNRLSGGPSGYVCIAGSNAGNTLAKENNIPTNAQRLGNCAKGSGFGRDPYFNWGIQYATG